MVWVKALRHDVGVVSGVSVCVRRGLVLTNRTVHASRLTVAHMGVFQSLRVGKQQSLSLVLRLLF